MSNWQLWVDYSQLMLPSQLKSPDRQYPATSGHMNCERILGTEYMTQLRILSPGTHVPAFPSALNYECLMFLFLPSPFLRPLPRDIISS